MLRRRERIANKGESKELPPLGRRELLKTAMVGVIRAGIMPEAMAASSASVPALDRTTPNDTNNKSNRLVLDNELIEFAFDISSGALKQILHKTLRRTLKIPECAAAPIRLWIGTSPQP